MFSIIRGLFYVNNGFVSSIYIYMVLNNNNDFVSQSWGGKENGFGLAQSCLDSPVSVSIDDAY